MGPTFFSFCFDKFMGLIGKTGGGGGGSGGNKFSWLYMTAGGLTEFAPGVVYIELFEACFNFEERRQRLEDR